MERRTASDSLCYAPERLLEAAEVLRADAIPMRQLRLKRLTRWQLH